MYINEIRIKCPDCNFLLSDSFACEKCGWIGKALDNYYNLLPSKLETEKLNEDRIHEVVFNPVWHDLMFTKKSYIEKFEKLWKKEIILPHTQNFLELAGGFCYISALAKLYRPDLTVWASDVSPRYIATKSIKVGTIMEAPVDVYAAMDAENLPFDDAQFDAIFISHSMHHLGRIEKMFKEVWRVLKPGGVFFGVDIAAPYRKKLHLKDSANRSIRAKEFGIHEKSLNYRDWHELLMKSDVPKFELRYEPGPNTVSQRARKIQNFRYLQFS